MFLASKCLGLVSVNLAKSRGVSIEPHHGQKSERGRRGEQEGRDILETTVRTCV